MTKNRECFELVTENADFFFELVRKMQIFLIW